MLKIKSIEECTPSTRQMLGAWKPHIAKLQIDERTSYQDGNPYILAIITTESNEYTVVIGSYNKDTKKHATIQFDAENLKRAEQMVKDLENVVKYSFEILPVQTR